MKTPINAQNPPYPRFRAPENERCRFTSAHGRRCLNPLRSATAGFCIIHERLYEKTSDAEVAAIAQELLSGGPELRTREDVGRAMSQLFTLVAQKRIKRGHGALLAYVASLLLQTMGHEPAPQRPAVNFIWDIPGPAREKV